MADPTTAPAPQRGPPITVEGLNKLCEELAKKEKTKLSHEETLKNTNKEIARLEGQIVGYLEELGQEEFLSPLGKVKIDLKWRVNMPAGDLEKKALFEHLRERGIFDKYATVNSNSLNSLFMKDWEAAKERGEGLEFNMPGIAAPKLFKGLGGGKQLVKKLKND